MITTTDIANILYRDCEELGLEIYQKGNIPKGEIKAERIIIRTRTQTPEKYWEKSYAEINLCVPDIDTDTANLLRLNALEREANRIFGYSCGIYDGTRYRYSKSTISVEADASLKCHYVNVKILFEILNVI